MNWTPDQFRSYAQRRLASEQRTRQKIQEKVRNETNSHLGAVVSARSERNKVSALDGRGKERRQRKGSVESCCRVLLISCRHHELDDDSNVYSLKPIRDAIAASFGIDDADGRISWEYGQQLTRGEQGVIVRIEAL